MINTRRFLNLSPFRITLSYVLFGVTWILISDRIVASLFDSAQMISTIQTVKGWMFVALSGGLIFGLSHLRQRQVTDSKSRLESAHQQLQVLHRVFRHNFRNDMTVIGGYLELTGEKTSSETIQRYMETASEAVDQILSVSEKLSLISEQNPRLTEHTHVDLVDLFDEAREQVESDYPIATIDASLPRAAHIEGDTSLKYVVREALENAIEHNDGPPDACRIRVTLEKTWNEVTLTVCDNGPGIPEGELKALRRGGETPLVHSSGIGLWLIKWLCQFNGGAVEFEARRDGGTEVAMKFNPAFEMFALPEMIETESPVKVKST